MNIFTLRNHIKDVFGNLSDSTPVADAIIKTLAVRGIDLDTDNDPRLAAHVAVALCPEHAPRPLTLPPAEKLRGIDRTRAAQFAASNADALATASAGRATTRAAVTGRIQDAKATRHYAERRLGELTQYLNVEVPKVQRLRAQLEGPFAPSARPALNSLLPRVQTAIEEAKALQRTIEDSNKTLADLAADGE